jgi:hypothetical protein
MVNWARRLVALSLVGLAVATSSFAAETERIRLLSGPGIEVTRLPDFRSVSFSEERGTGIWFGPRCWTAVPASYDTDVEVWWFIRYVKARTHDEALLAVRFYDFPVIERRTIQVRHVVDGRNVGTIPAEFTLANRTPTAYESTFAFPLGPGRFAAVNVWSLVTDLPCHVNGENSHSYIGRMARTIIGQFEVVGSLPPAHVLVRRAGRRATGAVSDYLSHPVSGVPVELKRLVGRRWLIENSGWTATTGAYSLRARRPGRYRVVATLGGFQAVSAAVRMR